MAVDGRCDRIAASSDATDDGSIIGTGCETSERALKLTFTLSGYDPN
jgi:hypothetical protein